MKLSRSDFDAEEDKQSHRGMTYLGAVRPVGARDEAEVLTVLFQVLVGDFARVPGFCRQRQQRQRWTRRGGDEEAADGAGSTQQRQYQKRHLGRKYHALDCNGAYV